MVIQVWCTWGTGRTDVNVEQYSVDEDPAGISTWRYHVTDEHGDRWHVEVYGGAERFYWIASGESDQDALDSGQKPSGTADEALQEAIADIRQREAKGLDG